jgi:hypothetical protein
VLLLLLLLQAQRGVDPGWQGALTKAAGQQQQGCSYYCCLSG